MLYVLLLLSFLTPNLSQAASNLLPNKLTVRKACDPLVTTLCCPVLQCAINSSEYALLPTTAGLGESWNTHSTLQCAAVTATCLAPYVARFTNECLFDRTPCRDPFETCCPGVREGNYLPAVGLACKGPLSAGALALNLTLLQFCPSFAKVYEFLPNLFSCDKDASILCIGYEMLTTASCLADCTADCCTNNAPRLYPCCNKLDCYTDAAEEQKED